MRLESHRSTVAGVGKAADAGKAQAEGASGAPVQPGRGCGGASAWRGEGRAAAALLSCSTVRTRGADTPAGRVLTASYPYCRESRIPVSRTGKTRRSRRLGKSNPETRFREAGKPGRSTVQPSKLRACGGCGSVQVAPTSKSLQSPCVRCFLTTKMALVLLTPVQTECVLVQLMKMAESFGIQASKYLYRKPRQPDFMILKCVRNFRM